MSSADLSPALTNVFTLLANTVRDWRAKDRRTTTAGITSALLAADAFDTEGLGFPSREEFWKAAESARVIRRERLPNGHWYILLPGESVPEEVLTPRRSGLTTPGSEPSPRTRQSGPSTDSVHKSPLRLRPDVWNAFVDWESTYRRYWDRTYLRAFLLPAEWAPVELAAERFIEIVPVSFAVQIKWMHDFVSAQAPGDQAGLEASLADGAPRGTFRRELEARGLARQWRERLRSRVAAEVIAWADSHQVDLDVLAEASEVGGRDGETRIHAPRRSNDATSPATQSAPVGKVLAGPGDAGHSELEGLRARMHVVIDSMAFDELAALPIRAAHLLHR